MNKKKLPDVIKGPRKIIIRQLDFTERLPNGKLKNPLTNQLILIIGPRGFGKSYLTLDLLYYTKDTIPFVRIINNTEDATEFYSKYCPSTFIDGKYSDETIDNFFLRQRRQVITKRKKGTRSNVKALLLLDDCLAEKGSWQKNKSLERLVTEGRHWQATCIWAVQDPLGMVSDWRGQFGYIFLTANDSPKKLKKIFEEYADIGFRDFNEFKRVFKQCTKDFRVMVIRTGIKSDDLSDKVFWYKAKDHGDFTVCHKMFWKYHKKVYNDNWLEKLQKEEEEQYQLRREKKNMKREKELKNHVEITTVDY